MSAVNHNRKLAMNFKNGSFDFLTHSNADEKSCFIGFILMRKDLDSGISVFDVSCEQYLISIHPVLFA